MTERTGLVLGAPWTGADEPCASPAGVAELREGRYRVTFARTRADLERVLRLRFEVFNRELGEGLSESWLTGLDAVEKLMQSGRFKINVAHARCLPGPGKCRERSYFVACCGNAFLFVGRTMMKPPLGPGTAPRTRSRSFSASIRTILSLRTVRCTFPY